MADNEDSLLLSLSLCLSFLPLLIVGIVFIIIATIMQMLQLCRKKVFHRELGSGDSASVVSSVSLNITTDAGLVRRLAGE